MGRGSLELSEKLEDNIARRDFTCFDDGCLVQFLRTFAIKDTFSDRLFNQMEK